MHVQNLFFHRDILNSVKNNMKNHTHETV